jgi:hypothetical protein
LSGKISKKSRGGGSEKKYFRVQFSNVLLYDFFNKIGIENNKSLTINKVNVPAALMPDFLRGLLDGDGSITIFNHPESQFAQIRIRFSSASKIFLVWLQKELKLVANGGYILRSSRCWQLIYAKTDSIGLIKYMYYKNNVVCLGRKERLARHCLGLQIGEDGVKFKND